MSVVMGADVNESGISTVCSSLIGLRYASVDDAQAASASTTMIGLVGGLIAAVASLVVMRMRNSPRVQT